MNKTELTSAIDDFLTQLFAAIEPAPDAAGPHRVIAEARKSISTIVVDDPVDPRSLPVCSWLNDALKVGPAGGSLGGVMQALGVLAPCLSWYDRPDVTGTGSANFKDGHGNAIIVGPDGLAKHSDLWIGASLLAPDVRYPDHTHPPEELYLVLSDGEFRNAATDWTKPGPGGLFHNPPGILHAMRSTKTPLLAIWTLVPAA